LGAGVLAAGWGFPPFRAAAGVTPNRVGGPRALPVPTSEFGFSPNSEVGWLAPARSAGWQPAVSQVGNLAGPAHYFRRAKKQSRPPASSRRYSRLPTCATANPRLNFGVRVQWQRSKGSHRVSSLAQGCCLPTRNPSSVARRRAEARPRSQKVGGVISASQG
jgi:hypothetical protein